MRIRCPLALTSALLCLAACVPTIAPSDSPAQAGLAAGTIVMWSGASDHVPEGWALCDGQNGTPDLRGQFVRGASDEAPVGSTGGAPEVTLTTDQLPPHDHGGATGIESADHNHSGTTDVSSAWSDGCNVYNESSPATVGGVYPDTFGNDQIFTAGNCGFEEHLRHSHGYVTGGASASHTHDIAVEGAGEPIPTEPPWLALAFIMKI